MSSNMPVIVQNGLSALSDAAHPLYLTLLDKWQGWSSGLREKQCYMAAADYDSLVGGTLDHILRHAPFGFDVSDDLRTELSAFFAARWRHNFMADAA